MLILEPIAYIHNDLPSKFGLPRQSGVVTHLESSIVFEPKFRSAEALRGLEGFSHLWLIWEFSKISKKPYSPTVRPPILGGNTRMGVFATRSPYRPNPLGLSSVIVSKIELQSPQGPVIQVLGADLMDGTPIYDIKPYLAYTDSHPQALSGFVGEVKQQKLKVYIAENLAAELTAKQLTALRELLAQDPRPRYHKENGRSYGLPYSDFEIKFTVEDGLLIVTSIDRDLE